MARLNVIRGEVLGIDVVRGFAPLSLLAKISKADIFDEHSNPTGTQRDLSPKHARDAYEYARITERGYWPEVFLCVRDPGAVAYKERSKGVGILTLNEEALESREDIAISRADGNHRLELADGRTKGVPELDRIVSFCMAMSLTLPEEIAIFRDINDNQKSMDTSHLDKIEIRLSGEEAIKTRDPALYIANKLANDEDSVLRGFIYQGGKRPPGTIIPLRGLHSGIQYMLSRQTRLTALGGVDAQLVLIKNYFAALKDWVPEAWKDPKEYLLLRGAAFWGTCFLGADVIDRVLAKKSFEKRDMIEVLKSGRKWDWGRNGDFSGYSGRGGAVKIADQIIRELKDEEGVSMGDLLKEILQSKKQG
jgi:DGQHR domain-containing protein